MLEYRDRDNPSLQYISAIAGRLQTVMPRRSRLTHRIGINTDRRHNRHFGDRGGRVLAAPFVKRLLAAIFSSWMVTVWMVWPWRTIRRLYVDHVGIKRRMTTFLPSRCLCLFWIMYCWHCGLFADQQTVKIDLAQSYRFSPKTSDEAMADLAVGYFIW